MSEKKPPYVATSGTIKLHVILDLGGDVYVVRGANNPQEAISMVNFNLNEQGNALNLATVYSVEIPLPAERGVWGLGPMP